MMAGGRGTRIASVASDIPKSMIPVGGKPVLEQEILCLKRQGITDLILTVGYLGDVIQAYFGDGSRLGVSITYFKEETPLGNAGALYDLKDQLSDPFLLVNGDVMFDVDIHRFLDFHKKTGALVTLFAHPNSHPYDSGLLVTDETGAVCQWLAKEDERPAYYHNCVNAGLHILDPKVLEHRPETEKVDLDRQILKPLAGTGTMYVYHSSEYIQDMGTPKRYETVCQDFESGRIWQKNLQNKQRAVFLDRDGTINRYVGFLRDPAQFELEEGAADAIRQIHEKGYLVVVVTNQPVIARGEVSLEGLEEIHKKMETLLGEQGAYVDAIYFCPHHPDKGFEGERQEYKVICDCRKPKPGMLLKAAREWNIDLSASWMAGDGKQDMEAGKAAGCRTALIGTEDYGQDCTVQSLKEFAEKKLETVKKSC